MLVKKAYKFRLYPNERQKELIDKTTGCAKFVFNFSLAEQRKKEKLWLQVKELVQAGISLFEEYKTGLFSKYQAVPNIPKLKKNYSWLKEVDSTALQSSIEDLHEGYTRFYKKQGGKPRFKSKKNPVQSFTSKRASNNIEVIENRIKLPKLGSVKFANSREVVGDIKRITVRKAPSGRYYISVLTDTEVVQLPKTGNTVGIDVGLVRFATLSNGKEYVLPTSPKLEQKLIQLQKVLSRRKVGSSNWEKQRKKVARVYEKIKNMRTDYLQKFSTMIIKNHDNIGVEDLKVSKMVKGRTFSKEIGKRAWYSFRVMLEYKALWYGKKVIAVNPHCTSQTCSKCEHVSKENRKSQSEFECVSCGYKGNADVNAALNIRDLVLVEMGC
ncbi:RNA-guided endonuclease TnpB family protein [Bacillus toyonensis]|uniref:RNA-guided endonuclease TnpB family protein n=1 Tax=Bacillus toyonensis TaxID=155322 RepID=UPI000BEF9084|nr:RNA-guided endonuclease TnpB family protein [Bacillus toyonensis]PEI71533.1 transposase [Bacillus toyonensis]